MSLQAAVGSQKRIAVIGAGPIGLEAALYAATLGHDVVVYERGDLAQAVRSLGPRDAVLAVAHEHHCAGTQDPAAGRPVSGGGDADWGALSTRSRVS